MILMGHNGAGKSTLIAYLLRFYIKSSHHPFIKNFKQHISPLKNQKIGYVPEIAPFDLSLNAKEYFKIIAALREVNEYDIYDLLEQVKLSVDPSMTLSRYSKGMKQRLLLSLALLGDPDVIVLDEPTSGLDPFGQEIIKTLLISLKQRCKLILSTHNLDLAYYLGDIIWIIQEGKIVYKGKPETLESLHATLMKFKPEVLQ